MLAYQRHKTAVESFLPENDNMMTTRNKLRPNYTWPKAKTIEVKNVIMDLVENDNLHISMGRLKCNTKLHTCKSIAFRLKENKKRVTPVTTVFKGEQTLRLALQIPLHVFPFAFANSVGLKSCYTLKVTSSFLKINSRMS